MPLTFHTKSYADIPYLNDVGKQLITLMGHTPNVPGAILASDLPAAIAHLRAAIAATETPQPETDEGADEDERSISLSKRALPLLELLEAASAEKENVMWD